MGPRRGFVSLLSACAVIATTLVLSTPVADAVSPGPLVYGVNSFGNEARGEEKGLQSFDAFTGDDIGGHQIVVTAGTIPGVVLGATGLAVDPTTDIAYVLLRMVEFENTRILATIDLSNGEATTIGDTTRRLTGLTFDSAGTLYASEGGGNLNPHTCPNCLVTLNKTTAAPTNITTLTACANPSFSGCGHGIAFNPDDGLIYHTSGEQGGTQVFESVNTTTFVKTPIGYTGTPPDFVYGIGYDDVNNRFILTDWNQDVFSVNAAGVSNQLPSTQYWLKGLHVSDDPVPTDAPPVAVNDTLTVTEGEGSTQIDVLANDTNPDGGPESIQSVTQPANGLVQIGSFNSVPMLFYRPDSGYCNDGVTTDDFTYTLNGGSTATVSVTVTCVAFEGPLVFGVNPFGNSDFPADGGLQAFDAGTGLVEDEHEIVAVLGSAITGDVDNATALAVDPRTGVMYATLSMSSQTSTDVLATIDPMTGEAITIGDTGEEIAGLTFSTTGTLYAVTASFADSCFNCLFTVNKSTAAMKRVKKLSSSSYEAIAYNPLDKKIYRASESGLDAIDPARTFALQDLDGNAPTDPYGLGFDARLSAFWLIDSSAGLWQVASNGGAIDTPVETPTQLRGLVVSEPTLSVKYSATKRKFTGKLWTPGVAECDDARDVSIWREVIGADPLVGEATTLEDGSFVLAQRVGRGKYYATVDDAPPVGVFPCNDARSKTISVR